MYDSSPTSFSCDYELSLLNAIREVFPATEIWGCYFHFSQNFRRNLGEVSFYFVFLRFIIPLLVWFTSWSRQWSGISSSSTNVACIGICSWRGYGFGVWRTTLAHTNTVLAQFLGIILRSVLYWWTRSLWWCTRRRKISKGILECLCSYFEWYVLLCYTHVMFENENSKKLQFFVKNIIL